MKMFRTCRLQKIVKIPQVHVINEVAKVSRSMRRQVPMIHDETKKDQKPEEMQISFSSYFTSRTDKVQITTRDSR